MNVTCVVKVLRSLWDSFFETKGFFFFICRVSDVCSQYDVEPRHILRQTKKESEWKWNGYFICAINILLNRVFPFFSFSELLLLSTNFFLFLFIIEIILYPRNDDTYCVLVGRVLFFINYLHLIANVVRVRSTQKKKKKL